MSDIYYLIKIFINLHTVYVVCFDYHIKHLLLLSD